MALRRLVLFDIDGTLLKTDGLGTAAMVEALTEIFGVPVDDAGYTTSGKTDTQICLELMRRHGFEEGVVLTAMDRFRPRRT